MSRVFRNKKIIDRGHFETSVCPERPFESMKDIMSYINPLKPKQVQLIIQSVPQRKHNTSPLQISTG
jgi:hypothetical protein